jgi:uroporphyrinogen-III synthase
MTIGAVTAERRAAQQADLLNTGGAVVRHGPTLRGFSLDEDQALRSRTAEVIARPPDFLLASTGLGRRSRLAAADS